MKIIDQLNSLVKDRDNFVTKLRDKGVEVEDNETFTSLVKKIESLSSGAFVVKSIEEMQAIKNAKPGDYCIVKEIPTPNIPAEATLSKIDTAQDIPLFSSDIYDNYIFAIQQANTGGKLPALMTSIKASSSGSNDFSVQNNVQPSAEDTYTLNIMEHSQYMFMIVKDANGNKCLKSLDGYYFSSEDGPATASNPVGIKKSELLNEQYTWHLDSDLLYNVSSKYYAIRMHNNRYNDTSKSYFMSTSYAATPGSNYVSKSTSASYYWKLYGCPMSSTTQMYRLFIRTESGIWHEMTDDILYPRTVITPTTKQQIARIPSGFSGLKQVIVEGVQLEGIWIGPHKESQTYYPQMTIGFNEVTVAGIDSNVDPNIQPENIKKGVDILGTIGTLEAGSAGIHKVTTMQEMNAIENPKEDDYCLVIDGGKRNLIQSDTVQHLYFVDEVTLPNSGYVNGWVSSDDYTTEVNVYIYNNSCEFRIYGTTNGMAQIFWDSDDGLHYTKRAGSPSEVELNVPLNFNNFQMWNNNIGYFAQISSVSFDGLFQYKNGYWTNADLGYVLQPSSVISGHYYDSEGSKEGTLGSFQNKQDVINMMGLYRNFMDAKPTDLSNVFTRGNTGSDYKIVELAKLLDTSECIDMNQMFYDATNATDFTETWTLDLSNFDTSKVTNMQRMFSNFCCYSVVVPFNTQSVTNMAYTFQNTRARTLDLSTWTTENVTTFQSMFNMAMFLQFLDIRNFTFNTNANTSSMFSMVSNCTVIVKDEATKTKVKSLMSSNNNTVLTVAEYEGQ